MIPKTPRGFRDVLPTEEVWRQAIRRAVDERYRLWGYQPVETPAVELLDVLEMDGDLSDMPFRFFDSDNNLLVLRPDVTLPVARLTALRLKGQDGPFRLCYAQHVFTENDSTYGQDRQVFQSGIEFIGARGYLADAEVLCLLFEALSVTGLKDFTVAIGTVGVLNALVNEASDDADWKSEVFSAFHRSDLVALERLSTDGRAKPIYAKAVSELAHIRGGKEAFDTCRNLVAPLGCEDGLDDLERTFELVTENTEGGRLMVDFSVISSFDYYTGMVFRAFAPQVPAALASGGRYDGTLESFGSPAPAAGFALVIEQVMHALEAQGVRPPQIEAPQVVAEADPKAAFSKLRALHDEGTSAVLGGGAR
ncbi:MAG: ATP phosphoribosyltransferase regulatory subunit [Coriobacteriales bacterium]|jgi:ATP phosphoribosyltransferase